MYGADPRLFPLGHEDRLPAAVRRGGRRSPARRRGPARRSTTSTTRSLGCAPRGRRWPRRSSSSTRASPGAATRVVDLGGLPAPGSPDEARGAARAASRRCASSTRETPLDDYLAELAERGGIVEERIAGDELRSPSVQLRVTPLGEVELLSTHDQVLGGPSGQSYLGCRFPADFGYAQAITRDAAKIGRAARRGGRARPFRARLRRRPRTRRAPGRRTPSSSTCARAARRTRSSPCSSSPTAATTRRRRCSPTPSGRGEAPRRDRPPRVDRSCAGSASTTCSTSSPATACTSTRRARPGSSST